MSKGNTFENDLLKLIFNATPIANIADNAGVGPLTDLEVALHTADPGEAGVQTAFEPTYDTYARVTVARSGAGWIVTAASVSPAATISFPVPGAGAGQTCTHASVGTAHSGAGKILYSGVLTPNIVVTLGQAPQILISSTITED